MRRGETRGRGEREGERQRGRNGSAFAAAAMRRLSSLLLLYLPHSLTVRMLCAVLPPAAAPFLTATLPPSCHPSPPPALLQKARQGRVQALHRVRRETRARREAGARRRAAAPAGRRDRGASVVQALRARGAARRRQAPPHRRAAADAPPQRAARGGGDLRVSRPLRCCVRNPEPGAPLSALCQISTSPPPAAEAFFLLPRPALWPVFGRPLFIALHLCRRMPPLIVAAAAAAAAAWPNSQRAPFPPSCLHTANSFCR